MSENENQQSTIASNLCKNGCGFYGATQFDGMCSVCYKNNMKKKQKQDEEQIQNGKQSPAQHSAAFCTVPSASLAYAESLLESPSIESASAAAKLESNDAEAATEAEATTPLKAGGTTTVPVALQAKEEICTEKSEAAAGEAVGQKKRNRCGVCKKKVGLTGFGCRCGGMFCGLHRYSDKHECDFDYQTLGQKEIRKANPLVVSSKIEKL